MSLNPAARCQSAYIGHVLASNYDTSIHLATVLGEHLVKQKALDPVPLLSQYLTLHETGTYGFGCVMTKVYDHAKSYRATNGSSSSPSATSNPFNLDESKIQTIARSTHDQTNQQTAACGPAHRAFPLALCPTIHDDDLFDVAMKEAALTHFDPIAGQVSGVINVICRSMIRGKDWYDAVEHAFNTPRLHSDLLDVSRRHTRSSSLFHPAPSSYAPAALLIALNSIHNAKGLDGAIANATKLDKFYSLPIVGILGGVKWGVSVDSMSLSTVLPEMKRIRETASNLGNLWSSEHVSINV